MQGYDFYQNRCSARMLIPIRMRIRPPMISILLPRISSSRSPSITPANEITKQTIPMMMRRNEHCSLEHPETDANGKGIDAGCKGENNHRDKPDNLDMGLLFTPVYTLPIIFPPTMASRINAIQ